MQWHDVTRKVLGGPGKILGAVPPPGTPLARPLFPGVVQQTVARAESIASI